MMPGQYLHLFFQTRIRNQHLEKEPIQLRLRKPVSTFLLNRILCCHHQERHVHEIGSAIISYLTFLHYFKQSGLCFGRRPVDLINQDRSEEHTSELQSLMRNSYAVFCLKKKKKQ